MHENPTPTTPPASPAQDLIAATALIRRLYSAGWEGDHVTPVWRGTEYAVHHGTGRQVAATIDADGQVAELRITGGLTLAQAVAAVDAAGLAPTGDTAPADLTVRERLAAALHRIADDLAHQDLSVGRYSRLSLGVLAGRGDLDRWATYLAARVQVDGGGIPHVEALVSLGEPHGGLTIDAQTARDGRTEVERLRARVAELEAQQGGAR